LTAYKPMKPEFKARIIDKIKDEANRYDTNSKLAVVLDINPAQLSRLLHNDTERVVSDAKLMQIARQLNVPENKYHSWNTVKTEAFDYIYAQLKACQEHSISGIFCDIADIGKSHTAKVYCKENRNAVYIDCSQVKNRTKLIKKIAKEFGIDHEGSYRVIYEDLTQYIRSMTSPIVILDEAGDLEYPAFLELKALWNATEFSCGWYMMGADGLKEKLDRSRNLKKVGFAEIYSRFGSRYQRVTPPDRVGQEEFIKRQMALVAQANTAKLSNKEMYLRTAGSLRRVYIEIQKQKRNGQEN